MSVEIRPHISIRKEVREFLEKHSKPTIVFTKKEGKPVVGMLGFDAEIRILFSAPTDEFPDLGLIGFDGEIRDIFSTPIDEFPNLRLNSLHRFRDLIVQSFPAALPPDGPGVFIEVDAKITEKVGLYDGSFEGVSIDDDLLTNKTSFYTCEIVVLPLKDPLYCPTHVDYPRLRGTHFPSLNLERCVKQLEDFIRDWEGTLNLLIDVRLSYGPKYFIDPIAPDIPLDAPPPTGNSLADWMVWLVLLTYDDEDPYSEVAKLLLKNIKKGLYNVEVV